jgi:hypothetical protein
LLLNFSFEAYPVADPPTDYDEDLDSAFHTDGDQAFQNYVGPCGLWIRTRPPKMMRVCADPDPQHWFHAVFRIRIRINLSCWIRIQVHKLHLNFDEFLKIFVKNVLLAEIISSPQHNSTRVREKITLEL